MATINLGVAHRSKDNSTFRIRNEFLLRVVSAWMHTRRKWIDAHVEVISESNNRQHRITLVQ